MSIKCEFREHYIIVIDYHLIAWQRNLNEEREALNRVKQGLMSLQ